MLLVDTSVWIEVFRPNNRVSLRRQLEEDRVVTCLPVVQEVLQGFDRGPAFAVASEAMRALPIVESPLSVDVFDHAIDLYRSARRAGFTIRSSVDCLIAACAIRNSLTVAHIDRDFDLLARVAPLDTVHI